MTANPVGWFEIYVDDMQRARRFYETVFQVQLESLPPPSGPDGEACDGGMEMWAFTMSEEGYGATGALVRVDNVSPGPGGTMVYFKCRDCAVEAARAAGSGGSVIQQKMAIGEHGFIAIVNDSEGNMIGLHSMQ